MDKLLKTWQLPLAKKHALKNFDPGAKPYSSGDKQADIAATEALAIERYVKAMHEEDD